MSDTAREVVLREYEYLQPLERTDFFLAIASYINAIRARRHIRRVLKKLERDRTGHLKRFADELDGFIREAKAIRTELAQRAPEIDNSDMEEPDHASYSRARWQLNSFANFDRLADQDFLIGYPTLPKPLPGRGSLARESIQLGRRGKQHCAVPPHCSTLLSASGRSSRRARRASRRLRATLERVHDLHPFDGDNCPGGVRFSLRTLFARAFLICVHRLAAIPDRE